jgi:hypothetical protein
LSSIPAQSPLFGLFQNDFAELFDNLENWSEFLGSVYRDTSHGVGYYAVKSHSLSHVKIFPELEVALNEVTGYTQHRQQQAERRQMHAQRQTKNYNDPSLPYSQVPSNNNEEEETLWSN